MSITQHPNLLEALLDSWNRSNTIVINLFHRLADGLGAFVEGLFYALGVALGDQLLSLLAEEVRQIFGVFGGRL